MKKIFVYFFIAIFCFFNKPSVAQTNVTFYTSMGDFVVLLYDTMQPITAGNFIDLVNAEFYDEQIIHRVIDDFIIQGGDPLGNGFGGPGYTIPDEINPETSNTQKTISMANAGPNTGGSQFFINLVDNTYLDPDYPVFGEVISNFSVVQSIGNVATNSNDKPIVDVDVDSIRVTSETVSLAQFDLSENSINIYPNPVYNNSNVSIYSKVYKEITVEIFNHQGQIIYNANQFLTKGINRLDFKQMKLQSLANGIYSLIVKDGSSKIVKKFVILK